jgi:ankyrin repeat protein
VNDERQSALHLTCKQKYAEVVELLLAQPGVDMNASTSYIDETPLLLAAYFGHLDVARLLIDKGAGKFGIFYSISFVCILAPDREREIN